MTTSARAVQPSMHGTSSVRAIPMLIGVSRKPSVSGSRHGSPAARRDALGSQSRIATQGGLKTAGLPNEAQDARAGKPVRANILRLSASNQV